MIRSILCAAGLALCALGASAQTNQTDAAQPPPPPPGPPAPPADHVALRVYGLRTSDLTPQRRMEIQGALARIGKRAARAEQRVIPPGGVPTQEDTDRLTTDPLTRRYTGYNLLLIKF